MFIDELRGFCILLVVFYHLAYDLSSLINIEFFNSLTLSILRDFFAGALIFISGLSCVFSRNNLIRGVKCLCAGLLITLVTYILIPGEFIVFGILHMLGSCMILYGLTESVLKKFNKKVLFFTCVLFFIATKNISNGYLGVNDFNISIPLWFYNSEILFPFGFVGLDFRSADYYPLFPWLFVFLVGTIIGQLGIEKNFPDWMYKLHSKFFNICGKHSLMIYLLHQPVIYLLLYTVQ